MTVNVLSYSQNNLQGILTRDQRDYTGIKAYAWHVTNP